MTHPASRSIAALGALALIVAACGSGGSPTWTPPAPGASTAAPSSSPSFPPATTTPATTTTPASTVAPTPSSTTADPSAISITLDPYVTVLGGPLAVAAPDDGTGRLLVAAQDGRIWVVRDGKANLDTPFLDIHGRISSGNEQGLLGLALHPGFPTDPRVFVDYTDASGNTVVSSFRVPSATADRVDPTSETVILRVDQPYANHNGGALAFGPDGYLYISLGDGGSAGDPHGNGQKRSTLLGKILRIDVDHPSGSAAYSIPDGNPFVGEGGVRPEIWLYGVRNPWRLSFDRSTGDLWIGDVGQDTWEEVDVVRAGQRGLDLGWNLREGTHCFTPPSGCKSDGLTPPVAEYSHNQGCTVIGGYVYRGAAQPMLAGIYLFADYCSGRIWALPATVDTLTKATEVGSTDAGTVSFGEDTAGELYLVNQAGTIYRVIAKAR